MTSANIKTQLFYLSRALRAGPAILVYLLAFPENSEAKGPHDDSQGRGHSSNEQSSQKYESSKRDRQNYSSRPSSTFILSFGTGYAGQGYYYGPPNSPYYYQRSDVRYFSTRESVPRDYYSREGYRIDSTDASVQRELARRGYYHGYIDGQVGPQSRRAIASYQRDRGLRPTGYVTAQLLDSLGLR